MKPVDFLGANPLLADRVKLAILASLAAAEEPLDFMTLLESLELTRGNLSSHMRRLEEAELVAVHKEFVGRKPRTTYSITKFGRAGMKDYLTKVEKLLKGI